MSLELETRHGRILFVLGLVAVGGAVLSSFSWYAPLDDAFITFRYARNLGRGHGPVFNPGERVEGYSCPLWLALMTLAPSLGSAYRDWAFLLSLFSLAFGASLLYRLIRLEAPQRAVAGGGILALLLIGHPQTAMLVSSGMEPLLSACLLVVIVVVVVVGPKRGWVMGGLLLLTALNRPEGIIYVLPVGAFLAWRRRPMAAAMAIPLVGWGLSRVAARLYFGSWLPNTFHAKVGGTLSQVARGLVYLKDYFLGTPTGIVMVAGLVVYCVQMWMGRKERGEGRGEAGARAPAGIGAPTLAILLALTHCAFLAAVGGGRAFVFRHLAPVYLILIYATAWSLSWLVVRLGSRRLAVIGILAVAVYGFGLVRQRRALAVVEKQHRYINFSRSEVSEWLLRTWPKDTLVAANAIGVLGFETDMPVLDLLGLVDPVIARTPNLRMGRGVAGHERHNVAYVLRRSPAVILPRGIILTPRPASWEELARSFVEGDRVLLKDAGVKRAYRFRSVKLWKGWLNYLERR